MKQRSRQSSQARALNAKAAPTINYILTLNVMRRLFLLVLLAGLTSSFLVGPIWSHTYIEPGKQFVLGGQQRGAFQVRIRNSGLVPVTLAERRPDGTVVEQGRLEPRQSARRDFGAGSAALVRNLGSRQAEFEASITGRATSGLGMRYEALKME